MDIRQEPQTRQEFIRNKHREIYRKYLELLKKEKSENSLRAEHIGKLYYARIIARNIIPPMTPKYILKIINNCLRKNDN